jgi:hypothetical protein
MNGLISNLIINDCESRLIDEYIKLNREFVEVPETEDEDEDFGFLIGFGFSNARTWEEIHKEYRTVILAAAGAGKSKELKTQAEILRDQGKISFFIKIEDIVGDFKDAFEVGDEALLISWLDSNYEAWFFLDSVDEAKLKDPSAFSRALTRFANEIKRGTDRAHIVVSSRPYSWLSHVDRSLMNEKLFKPKPHEGPDIQGTKLESSLVVYKLMPLDEDRIRIFCNGRGVKDIDPLITQIDRMKLWSLAELPFDLDAIISRWKDKQSLESRFKLFKLNIQKRLSEAHNVVKAQKDPLNVAFARSGARRLAAAVVLTGISNIKTPDSKEEDDKAIDAAAVLAEWEPDQVLSLLNRGIFNDIVFSSVRFRHQEIKEILAAEWFIELLANRTDRFAIEDMFFKESYGEQIVAPKLRSLLPWIILEDTKIQDKVIRYFPEIIVEGGDPSHLDFSQRKSLLLKLVESIANGEDNYRNDNTSIARIANIDLSDDTKLLIKKYENNDDVIFYLGRLVWQGAMSDCLDLLAPIAEDISRPIHPRVACIRAIMSCGIEIQMVLLWQKILKGCSELPKELLLELIYWAPAKSKFVSLILESFIKLPLLKRYRGTGLTREIIKFIAKCNEDLVVKFIEGAGKLIKEKPYLPDVECAISEKYAWLINPLSAAIEKLVIAKHPFALNPLSLNIMQKIPELKLRGSGDYYDSENDLNNLVSQWPELNDALYWSAAEQAAFGKKVDVEKAIPDDTTFSIDDHFWRFDEVSVFRLFEQTKVRSKIEEQCVAISTGHHVYLSENRSSIILSELTSVCSDNPTLSMFLKSLLHPSLSPEMLESNIKTAERKRLREEKLDKESLERVASINTLKANPHLIINSLGSSKAEYSPIIVNLFHDIIVNQNPYTNSYDGGNWQDLIKKFGVEVAEAYRDAVITIWRNYSPSLQSESDEIGGTEPAQIKLGLAGIEIESRENELFYSRLSTSEVIHILRYLPWGPSTLNPWFEQLYFNHPSESLAAVSKELIWELNNRQTSHGLPYILTKIVYNAPYIHADLAPVIYEWALNNSDQLNFHRKHCVRILINASYDVEKIADLATYQIQQSREHDYVSWWFAVLIDTRPNLGIPMFRGWLETLPKETASEAAQHCIVSLLGGDRFLESGPYIGLYKKAGYLQSLYILLNQFIPFKDYRARINDGGYMGGFRDDAEEAMGRIYRTLVELPGKESYLALKQLAKDAPEAARVSMESKAYARAVEDGDTTWSAGQVLQFHKSLNIIPKTHKQLFELTRRRLIELKNELERANDSPSRSWQLAEKESGVSLLLFNWLNKHCREQFVSAREPELANAQRMDIWVQNTFAKPPVPIELKVLDQGWSGPDLCERLRNQLVGDYLREEGASCGVMLLVSKELKSTKRWTINGKKVSLKELGDALKAYWKEIQYQYPKIDEIEVIVIDLTTRGMVSKT